MNKEKTIEETEDGNNDDFKKKEGKREIKQVLKKYSGQFLNFLATPITLPIDFVKMFTRYNSEENKLERIKAANHEGGHWIINYLSGGKFLPYCLYASKITKEMRNLFPLQFAGGALITRDSEEITKERFTLREKMEPLLPIGIMGFSLMKKRNIALAKEFSEKADGQEKIAKMLMYLGGLTAEAVDKEEFKEEIKNKRMAWGDIIIPKELVKNMAKDDSEEKIIEKLLAVYEEEKRFFKDSVLRKISSKIGDYVLIKGGELSLELNSKIIEFLKEEGVAEQDWITAKEKYGELQKKVKEILEV